ncbi:MAG: 4-(cytidine 5'-diphospho)-2-C-methyl-D-erythritol kinase [Pseudomonadota bacterium]
MTDSFDREKVTNAPTNAGATADAGTREIARAKVNLFLHVRGRMPDGYHVLESFAVFPRIGDLIEVEPAEAISLTLSGPFSHALGGDDNLALSAARALSDRMPERPGAAIRLTKTLPVAAGIGGGSADAGATLRALARIWPTAPGEALPDIAFALGADAPVCLRSRPSFMGGVGEMLNRAPAFPAFWMVLVNPGQMLSTAEVFAGLTRRENPAGASVPRSFVDFDHMISWLQMQRNDLEKPARKLRPSIGKVLSALSWDRDCALSRMSGSGATCFGLFAEADAALAAAERIRRSDPQWWVAAAPVEAWSGDAALESVA